MSSGASVAEEHYGRNVARVELHEDRGTLTLWAHVTSDHPPGSFWHHDEQLDLELTLHAPADCRVGGVSTSWDLKASGSTESPFDQFATWVQSELRGGDWQPAIGRDVNDDPADDSNVGQLCQLAAAHAVRECDASSRYLALAFHPEVRMFVYGSLIEDWWRRVEQLIGVCPGVFVLGSSVPGLRATLTEGVRQGRRLTSVVRDLAAVVDARNRHTAALIRRAPRELRSSDLLAVVREPDVDINDMPSAEHELETWYAWCAAAARAARPLVGFVSKHALELARLRGLDPASMFGEIFDWSTETLAPLPSRRSSPSHVFAAIDRWHESLWTTAHDPATPFPPCPTSRVPTDGISARPLTTVGELVDEGRRMHHCVGIGAERALTGERAFFRAVVSSEPVTIEVGRDLDRWFLVEASGFANRQPRDHETIRRWVATLRSAP